MSKKARETKPKGTGTRNFWTKDEELLLAKCYIKISEDPNVGSKQKNEMFWYKVLDQYNEQAKRNKFPVRTKNMLTGKWTPMNREVGRFNSLVNETMERLVIFERQAQVEKSRFDKRKKKPRTGYRRGTELFGDDELPRPPGKQRIAKIQRSTNSLASSGSNLTMFQDMLQQQYELDLATKMERVDRETSGTIAFNMADRI
ncbi:hypothetical protein Tco_0017325 [Tanacetum coccineum]